MAVPLLSPRRLARPLAAAALLVIAAAGLGACSASDASLTRAPSGDSYESPTAPGAPSAAPDTDSGGGSKDMSSTSGSSGGSAPVSILAAGDRDLIRTGQMDVQVGDLSAAAARARAYVATQGGRISSENSVLTPDSDDGSYYPGPVSGSFVQLVIALPPETLDASMDALAELGEIRSRAQAVEDVTLQVVDLESRTATMRASIERVRALMDRATTIADVVALESELSRREADLESMTGQLQSLQTQAAVSTLVLTLSAAPDAAPADDDRDGALGALQDSLRALRDGASALLVGLAAAAPFAALIALVGAGGWLILRSRRAPAPAGPAAAGAPSEAAADPAPQED